MKYFFIRIIQTLFLILVIGLPIYGQNAELLTADSLFANQKYTEALKKYENIFNQDKASPAMLTKMAFIQEGLGNYADALFYLNLYYLKTSDKAALTKMRELAEEHNLSGFEYSDFKFMANFIRNYEVEILCVLLAFSLFLLIYGYSKRKKDELPRVSLFLQALTLVLIGLLSNQLFLADTGIVSHDHALLMTGPSAGAEPIDYIEKGNKVTVLQSDVLWTKIRWQEEVAYIRTKNLKTL
ncbi:MAG: SH3 domain-containing protein [Marinoscillum sp.]|uniref:hypothetical protein n=1 Tax=Marinoscillum sp. TaxID=2024838 RepID=UPI0032F544C8